MSQRYLYYALGVIFFANFLNYLDRQVVSALEDQIKPAFGLDKSGFGLLWTAFTVGYLVCAPLIGHLTDRHRRPGLFAICILIWSVATIGSGLAPNTPILFAMRFLIGIGEAGCLIIGPSLISDYFPPNIRSRMLSVFYLGMPLGGVAGYIVGGIVSEHFGGWRNAFLFAGIPGFFVTILVWLLVEPRRGGHEVSDTHTHVHAKLSDYTHLLRSRSLLFIILAQAFAVMILVPLLHFGVDFFQAERGMKKTEATLTIGIIALVAGVLGNSMSGIIGDRWARKTKSAYALLAAVGFLGGFPFMIAGFHLTDRALFMISITLGAFFYFLCMPAVNTHIANVTRPNQRAMAYALAIFILHLLGDTMAPPVFGAVSDGLHSAQAAYTIFSFALILAGVCCLLAARATRREFDTPQTPPA